MHTQSRDFTLFVKSIFPSSFIQKRILDVGSGDINGNNRFLFEYCEYHGNDVVEAPMVTILAKTKDLYYEDNTFHTIISTECFEHDPEYKESLNKIYKMLKPGGLFFFTCSSTGRAEHGTRRASPNESYASKANIEGMSNYYKNLTEIDLNEALPLNELFTVWDTYYNEEEKSLYFLGIKKSDDDSSFCKELQKYSANGVINTTSNIIL